MNLSALTPRSAWLPLTPRGVAAFARARYRRLLVAQFLVALLVGAVTVWLLRAAFLPPLHTALERLPDGAHLVDGTLNWPSTAPVLLGENRFFSVAVDLNHSVNYASSAHVQLQFGEHDWQVASVFGVLDIASLDTRYPQHLTLPLDRAAVEPWWSAREPFFLLFIMLGVMAGLFCSWLFLATLYAPVAWLAGFYTNRELSLGGSWRLAGAALLPGALVMSGALVLYGLRWFGLGRLGLAFTLHLVVGWIYLFLSPLFLPRHPETPPAGANPFDTKP